MAQTTASPIAAPSEGRRGRLVGEVLLIISAGLMAITLYLVFLWVPTDLNLGISQRIFYFHVPVAIMAMGSIVVVAIASALYLFTRKEGWDSLAYSAAELGAVFATLAIVTGSIWAKPVWGVWWTWDPKLTLTLVLWFIYASYLMLRAYGPKGSQGARYGAVVALIGAIDTPFIYMAANWWATAHPSINVGPLSTEDSSIDPSMGVALLVSSITFVVLYTYLLMERYSLRRAEAAVDRLYQYAR
jgi:heme exporter protein C